MTDNSNISFFFSCPLSSHSVTKVKAAQNSSCSVKVRLPLPYTCIHTLNTHELLWLWFILAMMTVKDRKSLHEWDWEEEKWQSSPGFVSGELAWVQFEMLFGDLSCSLNPNQKGGKSSEEMVIFEPPEPGVILHSLVFLCSSYIAVIKN